MSSSAGKLVAALHRRTRKDTSALAYTARSPTTCCPCCPRWRGKNSVQTVSTAPPCIHAMDSCHVSSQRDPTARLDDFLACPHAASVASRARCFSASTMRGWIVLTGHVATIHGIYAGRHGGYSLQRFFSRSGKVRWHEHIAEGPAGRAN